MRFTFSAVLLAALIAPLPAQAAKPPAAKAAAAPRSVVGTNWLSATRRTPEGAIVVGNPAAKVKLVEYLSLTCPHCAELSAGMLPSLQRDYIARGTVSLEVRHAVRDGYDFVASLLLRCEPPAQYLGAIDALFATQQDWMAKGAAAKDVAGFDALTGDQKMAAAAKAAGFETFFAKRGMSAKAYAACMNDTKAKEALAQMAGFAWQRDQIPGTPLVLLNGARQDGIHAWSDLEPRIKLALK